MKIIGIDIGTTSICGTLADSESKLVEKSITRENDSFVKGFNYERIQSPERIYKIAKEILDELICDEVKAIGVTGQMHGILYLDGKGEPASVLYTWQDKRGELIVDGRSYADALGYPSGYGLVTDYVNQRLGVVPAQAETLCTIHDYFAMKICSLKRPIMHSSDAASLGFFDVESGHFTIENKLLPCVTSGRKIIGSYKEIPVAVAIGDNQASFIGSGCGEGEVLVNVGTGSQTSIMVSKTIHAEGLELRPLYDDKYLLAGCSLCGGRAYASLHSFFEGVLDMAGAKSKVNLYDCMNSVVGDDIKSTLVFDTSFCGSRTQPTRRASVTNLSLDNFTPRDFIIATLNGIADELYDFYKQGEFECKRLVGSGNGVRKNPLLARILSEKFGCELEIPKNCEEAAFGASLFASISE